MRQVLVDEPRWSEVLLAEDRLREAVDILADLVSDTATLSERSGLRCALCLHFTSEVEREEGERHSESCPWRRAVEFLDRVNISA